MKRLHIYGLMALTLVAFSSCEADKDPVLQKPTEFQVNTPPFVNQLYDLTPDGVMQVTCSQPNYGLALAPTYTAEVSLMEDFGESQPAPDPENPDAIPYSVLVSPNDPYSAVMEIPENDLAIAICEMRGITKEEEYTDEGPRPLYMRVIAQVASQPSTRIVSKTITFPQVQDYFASGAKELDVLYTPGRSNDWNFDKCQMLAAYDEGKYHGFMVIDGEFKFTSAPNWDKGINYGDTGTEGTLDTDGGAGNLKMPDTGKGLYYADVNVTELTYTLTYISSVGCVGVYNGWNLEDSNSHMTSEDYLTWKISADVDGTGFKFVFNAGWTINLGGAIDNLEFGGGDLVGAGSEVVLDLSTLPYKASFE